MNSYTLVGLGLCAVLLAGCGASDNVGNSPPANPTVPPVTEQPANPTVPPVTEQPATPPGLPASPVPTATDPATAPASPTASAPPTLGDSQQPGANNQGTLMADLARQQLATTLGVPADSIQVSSIEAVEWPDSGLGCSQPGQIALQVITPGYRVRLSHGDQEYIYHTDSDRVVVPCNAGQ